MRFAVVGAGAIGGYVGACLARGGSDVTLIARGPHLAALRADGIRVLSPDGDFRVHPEATGDLAAAGAADVVFLGLKAYSLPEVAPALHRVLRPGTAVIAAQNGIPWWYFQGWPGPCRDLVIESVDPAGVVSRAIEPASVIGCVVYCAAEIAEPGVIRHVEGKRFSIGEPDERGIRTVMCTINGQLRPIAARDRSVEPDAPAAEKADPARPGHVAAPFGGSVTPVVAIGDQVSAGDVVAKSEAMKMEASITTPVAGTVTRTALAGTAQVNGGDLIMVIA